MREDREIIENEKEGKEGQREKNRKRLRKKKIER